MLKQLMNSLLADVRRAFDALALANAGEMLSIEEKGEALARHRFNVTPARHAARQRNAAPRKRIALACDEQLHADTLRYAVDVAARYGAQLDLLTSLNDEHVNATLTRELGRAASQLNVIRHEDDLLCGIAEHTRRYPNLLFVISSAKDVLTERYVMDQAEKCAIQTPWLVIPEKLAVA